MSEITLAYKPRSQFVAFHQRNTRFSGMVAHRRAGKTVACVNDLHERALYTKKKKARYGYIAPYYSQAKDIAWEYLKEATQETAVKVAESTLHVDLFNGARIRLYGADNPNTLRGLYFDGVVLDEYGDCRPSLWGEVILPTLADRRGWAVFIGTPKGKNHFYQIIQRAKEEGWFHATLKASETGILSPEDLAELKSQMTEDQYLQEFECSFEAAVLGTYYAHMIAEMERSGDIGPDPLYAYDPALQVQVATDLGVTDSTALWFWQEKPDGEIAIIDYHEADGEYLDEYYIPLLRAKPYDYAQIWLPHDAKAKTLRTRRTTIEMMVEAFGVNKITVQPRLDIQDGINAARYILPSCRFYTDTNAPAGLEVKKGIEALRAYSRQYNEITKAYSNTPLHNWASNGADAFRGLALVAKQRIIAKEEPRVKTWEDLCKPVQYSLNDIWKTAPNMGGKRHGRIRI